jgi:hypothetical protein
LLVYYMPPLLQQAAFADCPVQAFLRSGNGIVGLQSGPVILSQLWSA